MSEKWTVQRIAKYSTPILAVIVVADLVWIYDDYEKSHVIISSKINAACPSDSPIEITVANNTNRSILSVDAQLMKTGTQDSSASEKYRVVFDKKIVAQSSEQNCVGLKVGGSLAPDVSKMGLTVVSFSPTYE